MKWYLVDGVEIRVFVLLELKQRVLFAELRGSRRLALCRSDLGLLDPFRLLLYYIQEVNRWSGLDSLLMLELRMNMLLLPNVLA